MPSNAVVRTFLISASERLAKPITTYYNVVGRFGADSTQAVVALSLVKVDYERTLRQLHTESALIGTSGQMNDSARGLLNDMISTDAYYAERFTAQLPQMSREAAVARSQAYLQAQLSTMNEMSAVDLPTLPIYPQDRRLDCSHTFPACKCHLDIRYLFGAGNYDVYWRMTPEAEHCDDCLRLAATWNPLQIRSNAIIGAKQMSEHDLQNIKALLTVAFKDVA